MKARRRKTVRVPVMAAGGIVIRGGRRPLFAVVQRRKDNCWVLPKGKLKRGEKPAAGAKREAVEETGQRVRLHEFLGAITSEASGRQKIVHFWRMEATPGPGRALANDIKSVEWLPLTAAIGRLSQPVERSFLDHIGAHALKLSRASDKRTTRDRTRRRDRVVAAHKTTQRTSKKKPSHHARRQKKHDVVRGKSASATAAAPAVASAKSSTNRNILRRFLGKLRHNAALT